MRQVYTFSPSTWVIGLVFTAFLTGVWYAASAYADTSEDEEFASDVIELTNAKRFEEGLPPLKRNQDLDEAAMWQAKDMADNDLIDPVHHIDSQGRGIRERMEAFYDGAFWGENTGWGYETPAAMFNFWINSSNHRTNVLSTEYREIGVGYTFLDNDTGEVVQYHYWTQTFGARRNVYPVIISNEAASTNTPRVPLYIYGDASITEIRIRNDGEDWGDWQPYQSEITWELATGSAGTRTVYIELRQGDTVLTANDSIELTVEHSATPTATATTTATRTTTRTPTNIATRTTTRTATRTATPTATATRTITRTATPTATATRTATPTATLTIPAAERDALMDLFTSTNGTSWTKNTGWGTDTTPCIWFGVTCADGHIVGLDLSDNRMTGTLPNSIGDLGNLEELDISGNQLVAPEDPAAAAFVESLQSGWQASQRWQAYLPYIRLP